jgi:NADH-quinone oxidoreductase subunit M
VAVVYTSLVALVQQDMKKLIAYSSVAHMAFVTGGLFALNTQGIEGAMVMMLSHGLVSGALFLCVGVIYDRLHTREIGRYGGLADTMPKYALVLLFFTMASVGLPATSGFVAEFLVLLGAFIVNPMIAGASTFVMILAAVYLLYMYQRVFTGPLSPFLKGLGAKLTDVTPTEILTLAPLAALIVVFGVMPTLLTSSFAKSVETFLMSAISVVGQ